MRKCSVAGCDQPLRKRGMCNAHYCHWYYHNGGVDGDYMLLSFRTDDRSVWKVRFDKKWRLSEATGCWLWIGNTGKPSSKYAYTYGQFMINGRRTRAHRASWMIHQGDIPGNLHVLHRCNNSLCVNPNHLYLGTHEQNMKDMATSLRSWHLKLMPDQVREIRASKESARILAAKYSVDRSTIKDIKNFKTRKHV